jgi:hypothetical protein
VPDEPLPDRPRRRVLLLTMLVTGALLLAMAGMTIAGTSSSSSSGGSGGSGAVQPGPSVAPAADMTHRGRHCRHGEGRGGQGAPQSSSTEAPPV